MTKRLLILSFSDISGDARVLRQVRAFADYYAVTTCGFGAAPDPRVEHIRIGRASRSTLDRVRPYVEAISRRLRFFRSLYWGDPHVREAGRRLRGRTFDAVIANDIDTIPLALKLAEPAKVHADLHEYFPGLHDDSAAWLKYRKPYFEWLLRHYVRRAASATTVGVGLAEAYRANYGLDCAVVTNASPLRPFEPTPVGSPIRLVHSGVAQPGRQLEITMSAAARSATDVSLDLYLMPNDDVYLRRLRALADQLGPRVTVREPLDHSELIPTLNGYDVGVFVLPPTTFNNANALPNKFFDFVQARLGILIGPSPEMAMIVSEHGMGAISDDFTESSLVALLDSLSPELVSEWKNRSDAAASALSAEHQVGVWTSAVAKIVEHA